MTKSFVVELRFPLKDCEDLDEQQLAFVKSCYLSQVGGMLPLAWHRFATFDIVEDDPLSLAERMMEHVRAEFRKYDNQPVYRPPKPYYKTYYKRPMGEQTLEGGE